MTENENIDGTTHVLNYEDEGTYDEVIAVIDQWALYLVWVIPHLGLTFADGVARLEWEKDGWDCSLDIHVEGKVYAHRLRTSSGDVEEVEFTSFKDPSLSILVERWTGSMQDESNVVTGVHDSEETQTMKNHEKIAAYRQGRLNEGITYQKICDVLEVDTLSGQDLSDADLRYGNFIDGDFSHAYMVAAQLSMSNFTGANFSGHANLWKADMEFSTFDNADLTDALMHQVEGESASFKNAKLAQAYVIDSDFSDAIFFAADLRDVFASNANFDNADFACANLLGADLSGSSLKGAYEWGGLSVLGLPSDDFVLFPTPEGWYLTLNWGTTTLQEFEDYLNASPSEGRTSLHNDALQDATLKLWRDALSLIHGHTEFHADAVGKLKEMWNEDNVH